MAALDTGCAHTTRPHWYTYALVKGRASYGNVFTPLSFSLPFLPVPSLSSSFFFHFTSSSCLSFLQLNRNNYDLHLRITQTFCLHLSRSSPLLKTLTVNHYLRIEYFQQSPTVPYSPLQPPPSPAVPHYPRLSTIVPGRSLPSPTVFRHPLPSPPPPTLL